MDKFAEEWRGQKEKAPLERGFIFQCRVSQISWYQKRIDRENAAIHDQYLTPDILFIIVTPVFIYLFTAESGSVRYCWSVFIKEYKSAPDYLCTTPERQNYCFLVSSSANESMKACCCGDSVQEAGTWSVTSLRTLRRVSRCWHIGFTASLRPCTVIVNPRISRPVTPLPPKTAWNREIPPARLCAWALDSVAAHDFLTALLTSYNRLCLSFGYQTIGISNHHWDKS